MTVDVISEDWAIRVCRLDDARRYCNVSCHRLQKFFLFRSPKSAVLSCSGNASRMQPLGCECAPHAKRKGLVKKGSCHESLEVSTRWVIQTSSQQYPGHHVSFCGILENLSPDQFR